MPDESNNDQSAESAGGLQSTPNNEQDTDYRLPWLVVEIALAASLLVVTGFGLYLAAYSFLSVELLIGIGAACVGAFLGFLFGIPRSGLNSEAPRTSDQNDDIPYRPSTNLEQISDWLTKILIGVGLVELRGIGNALSQGGEIVANSLKDAPSGTSIITQAVSVIFVIGGFLSGFMWTRIYYGPMQALADKNVIGRLKNKIVDLKGKLVDQQSKTRKVENLAEMIAKGELATPSLPRQARSQEVQIEKAPPQWPDELQQKVNEFLDFPPKWNSDPNARLFPDVPNQRNGYKLEALSTEVVQQSLVIQLAVNRADGLSKDETVTFLLHPTYAKRVERVKASGGIAKLEIWADGWFTVVAIVESDFTVLSLNLRTLPEVPNWFKKN
jgi:hypothetical protein